MFFLSSLSSSSGAPIFSIRVLFQIEHWILYWKEPKRFLTNLNLVLRFNYGKYSRQHLCTCHRRLRHHIWKAKRKVFLVLLHLLLSWNKPLLLLLLFSKIKFINHWLISLRIDWYNYLTALFKINQCWILTNVGPGFLSHPSWQYPQKPPFFLWRRSFPTVFVEHQNKPSGSCTKSI